MEMEDQQLSTQHLQSEVRTNQSDQFRLNSASGFTNKDTKTKHNDPQNNNKAQTKQYAVKESTNLMEDQTSNQSEKPKSAKSRRKRRKGTVSIIGLPGSPSASPPVLLWFRRDLRLCDNPALNAALEMGAPVIPVFIWSPEEEEGPGVTVAAGGASKLLRKSIRNGFNNAFVI